MSANNGQPPMSAAEYIAGLEDKLEAMTQQAHLVTQYLSALLVKQGWPTYTLTTEDMEAAYDQHGFRLKTDWQPGEGDSRKCIISTVDFTPEELADIKAAREEAEAKLVDTRDNDALRDTLMRVGFDVPVDVVAEWSTFQWMIAEGFAGKTDAGEAVDCPPFLAQYDGGAAL